jgi:hypothetical protein
MAQDDNTQRWTMFAIIAACCTGILFEIIFSLIRGGFIWRSWDFIVILVLAGIVGGGVFWACSKLNL